MENNVIKIRTLKRKDRVTVTRMIARLAEKLGDTSLLNLIQRKDGVGTAGDQEKDTGDGYAKLGMQIIKLAVDNLESDIAEWFADLCDCTKEQLDDMPLTAEIQILEQIKNAPEANDFFSGASRLFSSINGSPNGSQTGNAGSDSETA